MTSQPCNNNVIIVTTIVCRWPEDDLQRALYALRNTTKLFGIKISSLNSKAMTYKRQVPMRRKMVTENMIWEQVNKFTNLECEILILGEKDLTEIKYIFTNFGNV
jgi:hypothetical protein